MAKKLSLAIGPTHCDLAIQEHADGSFTMGVDGVELAVMAELLLRGEQTVGELRGRAARMATGQLSDVASLRPVLSSLIDKGLVVAVTPEGRGQIVAHTLFEDDEMERLQRKIGSSGESVAPPRPQQTAAPDSTDKNSAINSLSMICKPRCCASA